MRLFAVILFLVLAGAGCSHVEPSEVPIPEIMPFAQQKHRAFPTGVELLLRFEGAEMLKFYRVGVAVSD